MNICTYNIWDSKDNANIRLKLLIEELARYEIDILALQEVRDEETYNFIKQESKFTNGFYFNGLAILSNSKIDLIETHEEDNNYILRVSLNDISFTNVHLDWEHQGNRLKGIEEYFTMLEGFCNNKEIVLGDFNESPDDKIHFELVSYDFYDIHQVFAHSKNEIPKPTLDLINNPRWRNSNTEEEPERFDWIMVNTEKEININQVSLIGVEKVNEITPSDHYGVLGNIDFKSNTPL